MSDIACSECGNPRHGKGMDPEGTCMTDEFLNPPFGPPIWIVEEDGTHTPGEFLRPSVWPGQVVVQRRESYADMAGLEQGPFLWGGRNVLDGEGNRLTHDSIRAMVGS